MPRVATGPNLTLPCAQTDMASKKKEQATVNQETVPGIGSLLQNTAIGKDGVKSVADNYVDFFDKSKGEFFILNMPVILNKAFPDLMPSLSRKHGGRAQGELRGRRECLLRPGH